MSNPKASRPGVNSPNATSDTTSLSVYLRLLAYLKPHRGLFVLSVLGFILYSSAQPAMAQFLDYLLTFIEAQERGPIWMPSLIIVGIVLLRGCGSFIGNYLIAKISFRVVDRLRVQLFNHMVYLPGDYFDRNDSGQLMSVITFNVNNVTTASTDALKTLIREGTTVIALLAYLFYKNWALTLLMMTVVPLIAALVGFVGKRLRRLSTKVQHSMGEITQVSSEMISGYRVMRSFGGEDYEQRRFAEASWRNYLQNLKIVLTTSLNTPLIQMLVALSMGALLWVALGVIDITDASGFIAYFMAIGMVLKPMRQLSETVPVVQKGVAAADSVFQVLDEQVEQDRGTHRVDRVQGKVSMRNLNFAYESNTPVLHNISLTVNPGETVALVGRSGSGKSTLVSVLSRFYQQFDGELSIDDVSVCDYKLANLRAQMSLVTQSVVLFNDTVANNIAYGALQNIGDDKIRHAAKLAYALEFIEALPEGFNTLIGEGGTRLSGGQRQRLAIARAILKNAPILLLDEATSALDNESERYIQKALETVSRGRTTFVIAHRLSTIEQADKIVVMDAGKIVEQGTHAELLALKGHYARLYQASSDDLQPIAEITDKSYERWPSQ